MHRPLKNLAFAVCLSTAPFFLDPVMSRPGDATVSVRVGPDIESADTVIVFERDPLDRDAAPADPDAVIVPDAETVAAVGVGDSDDLGAAGGASVGVGIIGHPGVAPSTDVVTGAHFGTGRPSAFISRRAGAGGRGGGGLGQGGGGGGAGGCGGTACGFGRLGRVERFAPGVLLVPDGLVDAGFVFPLRCTVANAEISGWFASTRMTQTFANPLDRPLEAVYVFPLPTTAAVCDFEMRVGSHHIVGIVRRRADAEKAYADAIARGKTASLLTQERVNVFTQRVGNIAQHGQVDVAVTYFHPLAYDHGSFEYVFPMTVGPRYCPPSMDAADVARVAPPSGAVAERSGREVAIHAVLDAGAEIGEIVSPTHRIVVSREGRSRAVVDLARRDEVPNRDFVLRWSVAADALRGGCVAHRAPDGTGYFSAFLVPPLDGTAVPAGPRDVTFLLDASGSMAGAPFDTARRFIRRAIERLSGADRFDVIRFGGSIDALADASLDATPENVARAAAWLDGLVADGGTQMLPAVRRFADLPSDGRFQRIVGFVTDGFVGNEDEILAAIRVERGGARWFAFGVGSSVNRAFVEGVAAEGHGTSEIVLPGDDRAVDGAADEFLRRIESPLLEGVRLDAGGLPVTDVGPERIPDLYSGQPVFVVGRYTAPAEGDLVFRGLVGGRDFAVTCHVVLPDVAPSREALAPLWARGRIAEWTSQAIGAAPATRAELAERIATTALEHRLASAVTSFVCVDEDSSAPGDAARVDVASETPVDTR